MKPTFEFIAYTQNITYFGMSTCPIFIGIRARDYSPNIKRNTHTSTFYILYTTENAWRSVLPHFFSLLVKFFARVKMVGLKTVTKITKIEKKRTFPSMQRVEYLKKTTLKRWINFLRASYTTFIFFFNFYSCIFLIIIMPTIFFAQYAIPYALVHNRFSLCWQIHTFIHIHKTRTISHSFINGVKFVSSASRISICCVFNT